MNALSIARKLYLGFGTILVVVLVAMAIIANNVGRVKEATGWTEHTYKVLLGTDEMLTGMINMETGQRGFLLSGQDDFLGPYTSGHQQFDEALAKTSELTKDNATQQERLKKLAGLMEEWVGKVIEPEIALRREVTAGGRNMDEVVVVVRQANGKGRMDAMRQVLGEISNAEASLLDERAAEANAARRSNVITMAISATLCAVIGIGIAVGISRSIARRLKQAGDMAGRAARGDFSRDVDAGAQDEIGTLLTALNQMQEKLRDMLRHVQQSAEELLGGAERISQASEQVSVGAREQSGAAAAMAAAVEQLTVSINHVAESAREAEEQSREAGRVSTSGSEVIGHTVSGIRSISESVRGASRTVDHLGEHAKQISGIVNVIKEIADQTNLLALNAAIEAARAGEQGRGFAVVADEVRKLAERTSSSTVEIATMIEKIQAGTRSAVDSMSDGVKKVEENVETANSAGEAIGQIRSSADRVVSVVADITTSLTEQSTASNDVARNVEKIAQMSEENSRAVDETAHTAQQLRDLATELERRVAQFKL
ncbi:histidine kinase [Chitiniphilus shinanonensis]|uniref:Histidine kinase n=1 Tax=Chitiniphilus shinanonensis TaxID=553088 RepID=A0ABQ6C167_9NEIS|nr:methyl-accepting chemotaxis protein [Chitiniphilus shinanonensis]GLS05739.1 histidine kinase [Chitiniphilus shinanonensis]